MQNINLFAMPMTILFLLISGCVSTTTRADRAKSINAKKSTVAQFNVFDEFLRSETDSADGFDFAFGDPDGKSKGSVHNPHAIFPTFSTGNWKR